MAKQTGLGDNAYVGGYDLSGDIQALGTIRGSRTLLEATGINKSAMERLPGIKDGEISFVSYFNDAIGQAHATLKGLPTADVQVMYFRGTTLGNPVAAMLAKQVNYDATRGADGSLTFAVQALANASSISGLAGGLEWCRSLTAGKETDTGAASGTSVSDDVSDWTDPVTITSSSIANPTVITTATAHGLVTGDSVVIAGHTSVTPDINGEWEVTVLTSTTFTIPVEVTADGVDGTVTKTSSNFGLSGYLQVFSVTGTSITVTIEDSPDDSTFASLLAFTAVADPGPGTERKQTGATAVVQKYLRATSSGTFNPATFAVAYCRHHEAML